MKKISEKDVAGKIVVLRVDINLPVKEGKPIPTRRIKAHSNTIKSLSEKGAKVVVLSHQGREGDEDFIPLKEHSNISSELIKKPVMFVLWDEDYTKAIKSLNNGEILFLDNTRFFKEETENKPVRLHSETKFIKDIAEHADYYVLDALSIAHRNNASVVGFTPHLESFIGPELEKEINALSKIKFSNSHHILILGGNKTKDSLALIEHMFSEKLIDAVLLGGIIGELFLKASGVDLGKKEEWIREKNLEFSDYLEQAKSLLQKYPEKIILPKDVAYRIGQERKEIPVSSLPTEHLFFDVGTQTSELFDSYIKKANVIIYNGPLGAYKNPIFIQGTKKLAESIIASNAFSVLGGGDTEAAIEKCGFSAEHFNHISLAGKASLQFLSGKELVGLEVLK